MWCVQQQDSSTGGTTGSSAAAVSSKGKKEPKGSIATMFAQSSKNKDTAASKKTDTAAKDDMKEVLLQHSVSLCTLEPES